MDIAINQFAASSLSNAQMSDHCDACIAGLSSRQMIILAGNPSLRQPDGVFSSRDVQPLSRICEIEIPVNHQKAFYDVGDKCK